ncbi:TNR16-like protein [Mya arenaria]|uniref:TNR16-like protein n=1 Tax=Mya arenaria TaxID=6604 RepID=A0ABY7EVD6_MYAAR|nr:tumor necrosis factor receptor superfamily member 14-like [Mya arenaria]XP_052760632.1 tumor necrosis factor receptor superfamily member 14-like [Mya arenaria]XP_052760633.1 tumor necrosis factor receptor superfamily member 14-like [Mya arenaria]XP_052760634.1 tumor necrosis factor receptor superfamily member 14-like [Mya arenaria]XP_052761197.1 tumor necrosis factor receptor superfamily member 14-like [Mya arenaria]XP_052761198.1 tumor necrosis factor receptor superfamily member 14-like [M
MFNKNLNIFIVLISIIIVSGKTEACSDEQNYPFYTTQEGNTCRKCPPGHYLVQECSINYTNLTCLPCQPNTFTPCNNADRKCTPCRPECPGNHRPDDEQRQFISEKCTSTSDIVCSCVQGYWKEPGAHGECRTISTCSVGEGVAKLASMFSDTVCVPCVNGSTFSDFSSAKEACKNCTVCEKKETRYQPCLQTSNSICKPVSSTDNGVQSPSKTVNIWLIVGVVVGLAVFVGIALGIAFCLRKKCCHRTLPQFSGQSTEMESHDIGIQILEVPWPATNLSDEQLLKITATIGNGWELLATALGLDKAAIFRIQHDNNLCVNTQVFQALISWRNRVESPTLRSLYQIMSSENVRNIVTIEWEKLNSLIKAICVENNDVIVPGDEPLYDRFHNN